MSYADSPPPQPSSNDTSVQFCGNWDYVNGGVNASYPTEYQVTLEVAAYALSFLSCLVMLTIIIYTKVSGKCSKNYSLQSSEHILAVMAFMTLQCLAFMISASTGFHAYDLDRATCITQGTIYQFCATGILMEIGAMAHMTHKAVTNLIPLEELYPKHRQRVFLAVFATTAVLTVTPLAIDLGTNGTIGIFARAKGDVICWVDDCTGALVLFVVLLFGVVAVYSFVVLVKVFVIFVRISRHSKNFEVGGVFCVCTCA